MAQHFLLSAGASTMSAIDALAMGDEAYIIYRFATSVRGCAAAEIADDIEWPVLKTGRYLDKLRAIMRRQTADDPVAITAKARFADLAKTYEYAEDIPDLWALLAEAMWRDKHRRISNGAQFRLLYDALKAGCAPKISG